MALSRQKLGKLGEQVAKKNLKKKGYRILQTNYHCQAGEIDIIAEKKDCLVFVEVRTKSSLGFGSPEESITSSKKRKLVSTALSYISTHRKLPSSWRIDVIAIETNINGDVQRFDIIENAVTNNE
jgi:putative endonuclease